MMPLDGPSATSPLTEVVRAKLREAPCPLKLAEVAKGLPRPKKVKVPAFQQIVRTLLEEEGRQGKVYCYPSGKNGESRYWLRDEKQGLRTRAIELAIIPLELGKLQKAVAKEAKGTDGAFLEAILRELIADNRLLEHPPKSAKGKPLFAATPPPPPLPPIAQAKHQTTIRKLAGACRELVVATGISVEELLQTLQIHIRESAPTKPVARKKKTTAPQVTVDELILKAVANAPVVSLADLRREMPQEFRGSLFNEAVLRLADERKVVVSQDVDPSAFSDAERAEYVPDGGSLLTTISRWS